MEMLMDFDKFDMSKLQDKQFMSKLGLGFNDSVDNIYNEKMVCKCGSNILSRNYDKHVKSKKHLNYEK